MEQDNKGEDKEDPDRMQLPNNKGYRSRSRSLRRKQHHDIIPKVDVLERTVNDLLTNIENIESLMENTMKDKLNSALESLSTKISKMIEDTVTKKIPVLLKNLINGPVSTSQSTSSTNSGTTTSTNIKVSKNHVCNTIENGNSPNFLPNHNISINDNNNDQLSDSDIMQDNVFPPLSVKKGEVIPKSKGNNTSKNVSNKYKPKPIIGQCINQKILRSKLLEKNLANYKIYKTKDPNRAVIIPNSSEVRDATITILREDKVKFYTYTSEEEKCATFIIKGVSSDFVLSDVLLEFEKLGLSEKIQSVSHMKGKGMEKFHFFVLRLKPGVPGGEFLATKYFLNSTITIEKLNRTSALQCYKCQSMDHVAANCNMDPRCVKCAQMHLSSECNLVRGSPPEQLMCVLCGQKGHPASYRGCPEIIKVLRERESSKIKSPNNMKPNSVPNVTSTPSFVKKGISFANAFSARGVSGNTNINGIKNLLNKASTELFGCDYLVLKNAFDKFMLSYLGMGDDIGRKEALMDFILTTNYHECEL